MRFVALVLGLTAVACAPAVPRDGSCAWTWTDLPVPVEHRWTRVEASAGDGTYTGTALDPEHEAGNAFGSSGDVGLRWVRRPADRPDDPEEIELPVARGTVNGVGPDGTLFVSGDDGSTSGHHGCVGRPDGTWLRLDEVAGQSSAFPIASGGGVVVGTVFAAGEAMSTVEWDLDGHVVRRHTRSTTFGVNSSGLVLVEGDEPGPAVLRREGEREAELPRPVEHQRIEPVAVDDDGAVVGQWQVLTDGDHSKPVVARCS